MLVREEFVEIFPFLWRLWAYDSWKYLLEKNLLRNLSLIHFSSLYREIFLLYLANFLYFWVFDHFSTFLEKPEAFSTFTFLFFYLPQTSLPENQFLPPYLPQTSPRKPIPSLSPFYYIPHLPTQIKISYVILALICYNISNYRQN